MPTGRFQSVAGALAAFNEARDTSVRFAQDQGNHLYTIKAAHPRFGELNGAELLHLIIGHALRHLAQIRETREAVEVEYGPFPRSSESEPLTVDVPWEARVAGQACPLDAPRPPSTDYWDFVSKLSVSSLYLTKNQTYRGYCQLNFDPRRQHVHEQGGRRRPLGRQP